MNASTSWLGPVPGHWQVRRLGALGTLAKGSGGSKEDNRDVGVPVVRYGDLYTRFGNVIDRAFSFIDEDAAPRYTPLEVGTIVFAGSGEDAEDIGKSALSLLEIPAYVGGDTVLFRPREGDVDPLFLAYVLEAPPLKALKAVRSTGFTVVHINAGRLKTLPIPLPPMPEQQVIADFLDHETARIDELITEQQRLVELLLERRNSVVAEVVLNGLDTHAECKPSGHPRLGNIPAHWDIVPTRHLTTITTGSEDSGNATEDGAFPFYVRGREILRIDHYSFDCEAVMTPGDGQGGTGKVFHYVNGKFEAHQRVYVFKDFRRVEGWYFYYFLSTFLAPVALAGSNTVTMESLRRPVLADFRVAVPPIDEQRRITDFLDGQTSKIDSLIAETDRFIELARERRAALITAAVTGQIQVLGASGRGSMSRFTVAG